MAADPELAASDEILVNETASAREVLAFVWRYWRRLPVRCAIMVVGVASAVLLELQIPRLSAELVSHSEAGEADSAWQAALGLLGIFAAMYAVRQVYFRNWVHIASQVMQRILDDGFRQVQRFSLDWHSNHFAGSTQRKITRGMWAYDDLADTLAIELGPGIVLMVGFIVALTLREPLLGAYFGVAVTTFIVVTILISLYYVAPANRLSNDADTDVGGALADSIACNSVVKSFGAEARENARFGAASSRWRLRSRRAWLRSMDAGAAQSIMLLLLLGGMLALVLLPDATGGRRLGNAVYVITTYLVVHGYLRNIGWQVRNLQRAINEMYDLVQIAATAPQVADAEDAGTFVPGAGDIRFEDVSFGYRSQPEPVFDGLSVEIHAGEKLALVGKSGSGKSTFAKLLQRLYDVDAGRILIDGQDVRDFTQASLRRSISLVPQDPILFHRTLAENIAYARPEATSEEIIEAARSAHAHEFVSRLMNGYETLVGERGIKLSGGERQRVAIARAILANTRILVLDEATSSLDSITEQLIQDALSELMRGRTAVVIAHRLSTIRQVDRILVFDAGRIVEEGSHDELVRIPDGHYRRLVEMQTFGPPDAQDEDESYAAVGQSRGLGA